VKLVKKVLTDEEREKQYAEDAWLQYFNRYLFEHGTISEKEYKLMIEKIASRKSKLSRDESAM
jgi:hypothetical protein